MGYFGAFPWNLGLEMTQILKRSLQIEYLKKENAHEVSNLYLK